MKILKFLKNLFHRFKDNSFKNLKTNQGAIDIIAPSMDRLHDIIDDDENIARFIFSPININLKKQSLKPNCFKPPNHLDEISVNRYSHTNASFLKKIGLTMQKESPKKEFYGLALFKSIIVKQNTFDILYTPIEPPREPVNMYHSDIKIGHIVVPGEELPAQISEKIRDIIKHTILYKDDNVGTPDWVGEIIDFDERNFNSL